MLLVSESGKFRSGFVVVVLVFAVGRALVLVAAAADVSDVVGVVPAED